MTSISTTTVHSVTATTADNTVDSNHVNASHSYISSTAAPLQDWLSMSIPGIAPSSISSTASYNSSSGSYNSWQLDICRCCNKMNCNNFEILSSTIRKLEDDARLAAEIGQSLLHEHEKTVVESSKIRYGLEAQVDIHMHIRYSSFWLILIRLRT